MAHLSAPALQWPAESIWSEIEPLWPGFSVEVLPSIASTNSELMERARNGQMYPVLLVAERQTAGRGRQGRQWVSESAPGAGLTFSLGLPMPDCDLSGLSLVVGYSLANSLDPQYQHELRLKWPNDLWLHQRKLGGVLVEVCMLGGARYVVVGVGINIEMPTALPERAAAMPPACLQELDPAATAPSALQRVARPLAQALQQFAARGFAPWQSRFASRDALAGRQVWLSDGSQGTALGITARGGLRVATEQGEREILSDEISVRPTPTAP